MEIKLCTVILHMFHFRNVSGIFMIALLQRHSLCNEKNTTVLFRSENTDRHTERTDIEYFIRKSFQGEPGFFIKIID